ncbi:MAG: hypothetical protein QNJ22_07600 [Desulfosarcinaceae bacterium]|nr:hypothetical protein [Desulfosarcinaceae bacterium]
MTPRELTQQVMDYQQQVLDSWNGALALAEDQTAASVRWLFDTASWLPEEGRRAMEQWVAVGRGERERLKAHLDQGLATVEKLLAVAPAQAPAASKAPKAPKTTTKKQKKETQNETD